MKIVFLAPGEAIPAGYEILKASVSGTASGYFKPCGYIAFKRAQARVDNFLKGDPLILYLTIMKKSSKDELPENYCAIDRAYGNFNQFSGSNDLVFAMLPWNPIGLCDLAYLPSMLDRYPIKV
jgi:hypothetical protein